MYFQSFFKSFAYAWAGIVDFFSHHRNGQFHLVAAVAVCALGWWLEITRTDWIALILCIVVVTSLEAINSAIEYLTDLVSPDYHPLAGKVKDMAAGAVLLAAIGAVVVGALVLGPYLFKH